MIRDHDSLSLYFLHDRNYHNILFLNDQFVLIISLQFNISPSISVGKKIQLKFLRQNTMKVFFLMKTILRFWNYWSQLTMSRLDRQMWKSFLRRTWV